MSAWICPSCSVGNDYNEFENICENCGYCFSCGQKMIDPKLPEQKTRLTKREIASTLDAIKAHVADAGRLIRNLQVADVSFYGAIIINGTRGQVTERTSLSFEFANVAQEFKDITSKKGGGTNGTKDIR